MISARWVSSIRLPYTNRLVASSGVANAFFAPSWFVSMLEAGFRQPLLEYRDTIVAPKRLVVEEEDRDAENMIGGGFLLRALVVVRACARKIGAKLVNRQTDVGNHSGDLIGIVGLQLALPEEFIHFEIKRHQLIVLLREKTANQCDARVVHLGLTANYQIARLGPAPRVEVRISGLVFRVETALALVLDAQLKRYPTHGDVVALLEPESRLEGQIGKGTLIVRIHFDQA